MALHPDAPVKNVWFDVGTLLTCGRQPTGVPRTLVRIIQEWQKGRGGLRFLKLDVQNQAFQEIPYALIAEKFWPSKPAAEEKPAPSPRPTPRTFRALVKTSLAPWIPPALKPTAQRLLGAARQTVTTCQPLLKSRPAEKPLAAQFRQLTLGPTDLVLNFDAGWALGGSSENYWQLKKRMGFRYASLIYDLIPVLYPHFFGPGLSQAFTLWVLNTLWTSDLTFTISRNSDNDLHQFAASMEMPLPPTAVLRLGEDFHPTGPLKPEAPPQGLHEDDPFALCVGTVEIRKNHLLLYHAWRRLAQETAGKTPKLIIVGAPGFLSGELGYLVANDPLTRKTIQFLPKVADHELNWLYRHSLFTLYPSFYEGWGLPVAESLSRGKCCIASNHSSIPEISPDLIEPIDPCDVPGCLAAVRKLLGDESYRRQREQQIRRDYRPTTWASCVREVGRTLEKHFGTIETREERESAYEASPESSAAGDLSHRSRYSRGTA